MSFHLNNSQQMAIHDSLYNLTEREIKYLKNSWAETFSKKIFPFIEEDRFSVLHSDNPASRPNNPVNVYFGLLILREIFNLKAIINSIGNARENSIVISIK